MNVKKILADFYGDLRERKLLPIVAALLVALVAVPILLGGDEGEVSAQASSAGSAVLNQGASAARQLEPVVLAEAPGLRKYQERLDSFRSRNPFRQQYAPKEESSGSSDSASTPASGGSAAPATASGSATPAPAPVSSTPTDPPSRADTGGDSGKTKTKRYTLYYQVDVKVGTLGGGEKLKGVELLDYLPGKKTPVVQFIGVTKDLSEAVFAVSGKASNVDGQGNCVPNKASCEFLTLKVGQGHRFAYGADGQNYRIKLTNITEVRVKSSGGAGGAGASALTG